jgi:hypothetical protein
MTEESEFEVAQRRLCPDGSCTGLIGANGRCSECGRLASEDASATSTSEAPRASDALAAADDDPAFFASEPGDRDAAFDANRPLCPDGACVGVLDASGRCSVCGKMGEGR